MNKKYEIEYEEAPSGNVTFYNYKEPLMKFEDGFGFMGALVFDTETDKVQCHFCGEWFGSLPHHITREHNMRASDYKEKVGLFQSTALISESLREKLIASGLNKRLQNLRIGGKKSKSVIEKTRATLKRNAQKPEMKNLRGTCPAQLIDRLQKIYEREGENFSASKHVNFTYLLKQTFGSSQEAYRLAGITVRKPGETRKRMPKYTDQMVVDFISEFITRFSKVPERKNFIAQGYERMWDNKCAGLKGRKRFGKYLTAAYDNLDSYKHTGLKIRYTKNALLGFMRKFEKSHGRRPSISDAKRSLIPYPSRYYYHFGSWKNALNEAFKA